MSNIRFLVVALACFASLVSISQADDPVVNAETFKKEIRPFLKKYCFDCHGSTQQKAERRFDKLTFPIVDDDMLIDFQDALDLLNLGEMPPEDEPQPNEKEKLAAIGWLTSAIEQTQQARKKGTTQTVLRRLNAREYRYSVGDLLGIDVVGFDPTESFPADQEVHHLDNQGETLVTSGFLLQQYLLAADKVIDKALPSGEKPKTREWFFDRHFLQQPEFDSRRIRMETKQADLDGRNVSRKDLPETIRIYEHPRSQRHMGAYGLIWDFRHGVPEDGIYEITLDLEAVSRKTNHKENYARTRQDEPILFGIVPGDLSYSALHVPQPLEPELFRTELSDERETIQAKVWLNRGTTPRFVWPNGSVEMRSAHIKLGKELFKKAQSKKNHSVEETFIHGWMSGELPHIRIYSVKIRGPVFEQWPTVSHRELLGGSQFDPKRISDPVRKFMQRAFRRPVADDEVDRFLAVGKNRLKQGVSEFDAFRDTLKAILCSPGFLYLDEQADTDGRLTQHAIASRLSYFLWSSIPDDELNRLADEGKLHEPSVLRGQVQRMLKDPKSDRFVRGFLDSWLTLGSLGQTPPDKRSFGVYYKDDLQVAMRQETERFARHILDNDLSIDNFLDSDFTFVNSNLASLYDLDVELDGLDFQKVDISEKSNRGGLLGQASVLTVSANGVDTSPVVRGVWVLENLLGSPPNPPPPDVEPLDPDIRGAKSIRDQLEKHRHDAACAECHRKIDPLGFALENYDPIGQWRTDYKGGKGKKRVKIDASGKLSTGEEFRGIEEFREVLMKRKNLFARALTEKLMSYGLGRSVGISDRPEIDRIIDELDANGRSFKFLLQEVISSPNFIRP